MLYVKTRDVRNLIGFTSSSVALDSFCLRSGEVSEGFADAAAVPEASTTGCMGIFGGGEEVGSELAGESYLYEAKICSRRI